MAAPKKSAPKRKPSVNKVKKDEPDAATSSDAIDSADEDARPAKKARNTAPHRDPKNGLVELIGGTDLVDELTRTPLGKLVAALQEEEELDEVKPRKDGTVVYWMR